MHPHKKITPCAGLNILYNNYNTILLYTIIRIIIDCRSIQDKKKI